MPVTRACPVSMLTHSTWLTGLVGPTSSDLGWAPGPATSAVAPELALVTKSAAEEVGPVLGFVVRWPKEAQRDSFKWAERAASSGGGGSSSGG